MVSEISISGQNESNELANSNLEKDSDNLNNALYDLKFLLDDGSNQVDQMVRKIYLFVSSNDIILEFSKGLKSGIESMNSQNNIESHWLQLLSIVGTYFGHNFHGVMSHPGNHDSRTGLESSEEKDLNNEYQALLQTKHDLEKDIMSLRAAISLKNHVLSASKTQLSKNRMKMTQIVECLRRIFAVITDYGLDWRDITPEKLHAAMEQSYPYDRNSTSALMKFFNVIFDSEKYPIDKIPDSFVPENVLDYSKLPNLSDYIGGHYPEYPTIPPISDCPKLCDICHSRCLPKSAPVAPNHRETLLICSCCDGIYHLCCVEPPIGKVPENARVYSQVPDQRNPEIFSWTCSYCNIVPKN